EGVAVVVGVVDARALHHQNVAAGLARQAADRLGGQLGQARLGGAVLLVLELHVVVLEQAEDRRGVGGGLQLLPVPHVHAAGMGGLPFGDQVAAVAAQADLVGVLGVAGLDRQEFP